MSSEQKRGFRLPWAADRSAEDGAGAATLEADSVEPTTPEQIEDAVGDDLGEGPFHSADSMPPESSMDASPEASEVPETTAEAAMIDTESATSELAEAAPAATDQDAWTTETQAVADEAVTEPEPAPEPAAARPANKIDSEPRATRANPLVAGLVKAMREAALASREETTGRLQAEAAARVEAIRETAAAESTELQKRADGDIVGIREWSKAEIARVRQETEERIDSRKAELAEQTEQHEFSLGRRIEQVQSTVAAFEADMDSFFERLLAENDPARVAALAGEAPEPPDLTVELAEPIGDDGTEPTAEDGEAPSGSAWTDVAWTTGLEPAAAAEAEAAASEGLDLSSSEEWPATVLAAAQRTDNPETEFEPAGVANARLLVHGLTSVAGISSFKGALGQLPGVRSVSVSSGEPGVFIFTVVHSPEIDLTAAVSGMTNFDARVSEVSSEGLTVLAHEPS